MLVFWGDFAPGLNKYVQLKPARLRSFVRDRVGVGLGGRIRYGASLFESDFR